MFAPVAQLDRALASGAKGHRFKSCRACVFGLVGRAMNEWMNELMGRW